MISLSPIRISTQPEVPKVSTATPSPNRPRARYGTGGDTAKGGSVGGRILAIAAVVMLVLVLVVGGRSIAQRFNRPITAEFISQERIDDTTGRLWIDVTRKDPSVPSYCIVTAVDYSHSEVGRREVVFPAGGEKQMRVPVDLPVRAPLVSGHVYGCADKLPFYLDPESDSYQAR